MVVRLLHVVASSGVTQATTEGERMQSQRRRRQAVCSAEKGDSLITEKERERDRRRRRRRRQRCSRCSVVRWSLVRFRDMRRERQLTSADRVVAVRRSLSLS